VMDIGETDGVIGLLKSSLDRVLGGRSSEGASNAQEKNREGFDHCGSVVGVLGRG